jgi:hypothetical protein
MRRLTRMRHFALQRAAFVNTAADAHAPTDDS